MARHAGDARTSPQDDRFDMQALAKLGFWGGAAFFALLIAVVAARSDLGIRRLGHAYSTVTAPPGIARERAMPTVTLTRPLIADPEGRRLIEAVDMLSAERERLRTRLSALERNLDDMTGSIGKHVPSAKASEARAISQELAAAGPSLINTITIAAAMPAETDAGALSGAVAGSRVANAHAIARGEAPPAESTATKTQFGVDIGGASSMQKLRAIWLAERTAHAKLLRDLQPVVAVRDGGKPDAVDLRLIVGPLANAGAAARLCAHLASQRLHCSPSVFDGQKLSIR